MRCVQCWEDVLSTPDIRTDSPEGCTDEQTDVLSQLQELPMEPELINHGIEDEASHDLWKADSCVSAARASKSHLDSQAKDCP